MDNQKIEWIPSTTIIDTKRNIFSDRAIEEMIRVFNAREHEDQ